MTYQELSDDLRKLAEAQEWEMIKVWFGYWENEQEQIDKCILWGRFFLPNYFREATPAFHREIIRQNLSDVNEYCAAPRGFAKTTMNQLCIWFQVVNKMEKFIVVIEKTFNEASEVIRGVTDQFKDNEMINLVYGDMVKVNDAGTYDERNKDAQGDVVINGVRLRAKGFNTPIRGLKSAEWRPTKIYVDDVESDEHINNEEQRKKYRENYSQGIVPSVDIRGSIKVRGTILHNDSLLANLIGQFQGKVYRAFDKTDPENTLLWPERWSYERLMQKKAEMEMEGKGSSKFYQEYLNEPVDDEYRTFHWEWMQQMFEDQDLKFKATCRTICIDVADSKKDGSDWTAVTVNDWDQDNNWFIQYAKRYKVNSKELVDLIIELWQFWKPTAIGVEKNAFEDQVKPWLNVVSAEKGVFPIVKELKDGGRAKEDRIKGALVGRFAAGKIWWKKDAKDDQQALRGELYDFPNAKNDDLCLVGETEVATSFGNKRIDQIRKGDFVLTPFGLRKVLESRFTGFVQIIESNGLKGKGSHPVFVKGKGFAKLDTLAYNEEVNHLTFQSLCQWQYKKLLYSMGSNTNSWAGKESIILVSQKQMKGESALKDCMSRFGSFIMKRQYRKALTFITKIIIRLITTLVILSVYRVSNIIRCIVKKCGRKIERRGLKILTKQEKKRVNGTEVQKEENGIVKKVNGNGRIRLCLSALVDVVEKFISHVIPIHSFAQITVVSTVEGNQVLTMKSENVLSAKKNFPSININQRKHALTSVDTFIPSELKKVYNITVEKDHVYYANGVLVGNCDSYAYHEQIGYRPMGRDKNQLTTIEREFWDNKRRMQGAGIANAIRNL